MTIKCLAIDDEPLALKKLATYIKAIPFLELKGQCQSVQETQDYLNNGDIDAIFIDINMPDRNGMEFVATLEQRPIVVFTTAYNEYAIDGYKVDAVDYLLKPFDMDDFRRAAEKVKARYELLAHLQPDDDISQVDSDDAIFVKSDYKIVRIETASIAYIEAMSEYLRIMSDNLKPIVVLLSMKKMEEHLPATMFMRIHRSYIINLKRIREVIKNHVVLSDGTSLPIGEIYKDSFMAYLSTKFLTK